MSLHLEAPAGAIAETVLIPGDPLRAQFIADNFLEKTQCYNRIRGMLGFTGYYSGKRVSVQGTGMGMGSTAIYVNEMLNEYQVKRLIRVGTTGAIKKDLQIGEVILALGASGDSSANQTDFHGAHFAATANFSLLQKAVAAAKELEIPVNIGGIYSTDSFYNPSPDRWDIWEQHGILGVEMESQILYTLASRYGAEALSILTVSDNIRTGANAEFAEKERSFTDMVRLALSLL